MNYYIYNGELYHYGVVGMKWGVHRAVRRSAANSKLTEKALRLDKKSAAYLAKAEKIHAKKDLGSANKQSVKSAKYQKKAASLELKALNESDSVKRTNLERKAAKNKLKAANAKRKGDLLSKSIGYGSQSMKYINRSNKIAAKAAKARMKIESNDVYVEKMKRKVSSLSKEEISNGYSFVNELLYM